MERRAGAVVVWRRHGHHALVRGARGHEALPRDIQGGEQQWLSGAMRMCSCVWGWGLGAGGWGVLCASLCVCVCGGGTCGCGFGGGGDEPHTHGAEARGQCPAGCWRLGPAAHASPTQCMLTAHWVVWAASTCAQPREHMQPCRCMRRSKHLRQRVAQAKRQLHLATCNAHWQCTCCTMLALPASAFRCCIGI